MVNTYHQYSVTQNPYVLIRVANPRLRSSQTLINFFANAQKPAACTLNSVIPMVLSCVSTNQLQPASASKNLLVKSDYSVDCIRAFLPLKSRDLLLFSCCINGLSIDCDRRLIKEDRHQSFSTPNSSLRPLRYASERDLYLFVIDDYFFHSMGIEAFLCIRCCLLFSLYI